MNAQIVGLTPKMVSAVKVNDDRVHILLEGYWQRPSLNIYDRRSTALAIAKDGKSHDFINWYLSDAGKNVQVTFEGSNLYFDDPIPGSKRTAQVTFRAAHTNRRDKYNTSILLRMNHALWFWSAATAANAERPQEIQCYQNGILAFVTTLDNAAILVAVKQTPTNVGAEYHIIADTSQMLSEKEFDRRLALINSQKVEIAVDPEIYQQKVAVALAKPKSAILKNIIARPTLISGVAVTLFFGYQGRDYVAKFQLSYPELPEDIIGWEHSFLIDLVFANETVGGQLSLSSDGNIESQQGEISEMIDLYALLGIIGQASDYMTCSQIDLGSRLPKEVRQRVIESQQLVTVDLADFDKKFEDWQIDNLVSHSEQFIDIVNHARVKLRARKK